MRTMLLTMTASLAALTAAGGALADEARFTPEDFATTVTDYALQDTALFVPPQDAKPALSGFTGTISVAESPMPSDPPQIAEGAVMGRNPQLFPAIDLSFVTVGDDLVPATQDVIRAGTTDEGESFWDVIVQPGKTWSIGDDGWSRASFPFSLVNMLEAETHNGVAMFLYRDGEVSDLRYQILTQTAPYYVETYFTAAGSLPATLSATNMPGSEALAKAHEAALADALPVQPWSALEAKVGAAPLEGFDSTLRPDELVANALMIDDALYLKSCPTPAGELPYCDRQRFGVWSVSKSLVPATAALAVAREYGPQVLEMTITELVPQAKGIAGWDKVTLGDALNLATGMGYGQREAEPKTPWEPYNSDYYAYYEARSASEKLDLMLNAATPYDWGPGAIMRYRDEDMFLAVVALTNFLQQQEGPGANVWDFLQQNVYQPIGIHGLPSTRTIEEDGSPGQPLAAWGLLPTLGDLAKLARLYQQGGSHDGQQILDADLAARIAPGEVLVGLPTDLEEKPFYDMGFWRYPVTTEGCTVYYPSMDGWGENHVQLMPKGITAIRLAANWDGDESAKDMSSLVQTANAILPFCD
ncbi:serine hydrolase [Pseudooceanicola sp. HF7]|uniref:serine hydrolase n=1 Tax=Pseudooceanicola sp. HF7 TaxID=2721560 RepID=UPI0014318DAA|nr:serine hydrolase [Pseudooceanicola sp. HF7]NIZ11744.1 serine hydrolase [Pseudooceanicola sp. HF7]